MNRSQTFAPASFVLDAERTQLIRDGVEQPLTPKDFALLHCLMAHAGRVVPHGELLQTVWRDVTVGPEVLKVRIARLRRILGDDASSPGFIRNVHGEGYRFVGRATIRGRAPAAAAEDPLSHGAEPDSADVARSSPVVGRTSEVATLNQLLRVVANGDRQLVLVSGESGIGKTTLIDRFLQPLTSRPGISRQVQPLPAVVIGRGQCVEQYGQGEPFLPVMEAIERLARGDDGTRVKDALFRCAPTWLLSLPALVSPAERDVLLRQVTPPRGARMLRELTSALEFVTAPEGEAATVVVLVLEDLHWADPSTIDLLALLARSSEPARLLIIGSYRPDESSPADHPLHRLLHDLRARHAMKELELGPLSTADVENYFDARFVAHDFPLELTERVCRRVDGNPLFLTDIVGDLLAARVIAAGDRGWSFRGDLDAIDTMIPGSIRHLVASQRDRLGSDDQRLLEAASLAGPTFLPEELAAALRREVADVEEQCLRLAERHQFLTLLARDAGGDESRATRFAFLHALYRELWHERVSTSRRLEWHQRLGEHKERAWGHRAGEVASELAVHFAEAHDHGRAFAYHEQASRQAMQRAANAEARAHLVQACAAFEKLPDTPGRLPQELQLRLSLGALLAVTEGFSAEATAAAYHRAREICDTLGQTPDVFDPLFGLCRFFWSRGDLKIAADLGQQLLRIAADDPVRQMAAHLAAGSVLLEFGELQNAVHHLKTGLAQAQIHWHDALLPVYGHVKAVCAGTAASGLCILGYPDQAAQLCGAMLAAARESGHPFVLGQAFWGTAIFHHLRRDWPALADAAQRLAHVQAAHDLVEFGPFADVFLGRGLVAQGRVDDGITKMRRGTEMLEKSGGLLFLPHALALLAEGLAKAVRPDEMLAIIDAALAIAHRTGQSWFNPELLRLKGSVPLQPAGNGRVAPTPAAARLAETSLQEAMDLARRQGARLWELRTALDLASLWRRQGRRREARDLVADASAGFCEGFETSDLIDAKAFLSAL
jgi:DNA-binding winged helix-turn-helix (wHTH) protein